MDFIRIARPIAHPAINLALTCNFVLGIVV